MTSLSPQVALLSAINALTKVVMTTLSPDSTDVFQVLPYLTFQENRTVLITPIVLKHFLSLASVVPYASSFLSQVCLFLYKFLFLFYALNILVFLGFSSSPQPSFSPQLSWDNWSAFLALPYMPEYKTNTLPLSAYNNLSEKRESLYIHSDP